MITSTISSKTKTELDSSTTGDDLLQIDTPTFVPDEEDLTGIYCTVTSVIKLAQVQFKNLERQTSSQDQYSKIKVTTR